MGWKSLQALILRAPLCGANNCSLYSQSSLRSLNSNVKNVQALAQLNNWSNIAGHKLCMTPNVFDNSYLILIVGCEHILLFWSILGKVTRFFLNLETFVFFSSWDHHLMKHSHFNLKSKTKCAPLKYHRRPFHTLLATNSLTIIYNKIKQKSWEEEPSRP